MKLAAIYNVWDGAELLRGSMECLRGSVDLFIIVYQRVSNFGERYDPRPDMNIGDFKTIIFFEFIPTNWTGAGNEREKRNIGMNIARANGCTHFLNIDCDEYYRDFDAAIREYQDAGTPGSVCRIMTYFGNPKLRFENPDNYYVPFIHRLDEGTISGVKPYPFYVDPTRRINEESVTLLSGFMHHFSWVRKDIERKTRNSSARNNIMKSTLLDDYSKAAPGLFVPAFKQKLISVENIFSIPEL